MPTYHVAGGIGGIKIFDEAGNHVAEVPEDSPHFGRYAKLLAQSCAGKSDQHAFVIENEAIVREIQEEFPHA